MTAYRSALPRYSSFDGLQNAADAAGLAFVAADDERSVEPWRWEGLALFISGVALAVATVLALVFLVA
jgi:hypothetical protein